MKEKNSKILRTLIYSSLVYLFSLYNVFLMKSEEHSSVGTSGMATLFAVLIFVFILPIFLIATSSKKNNKETEKTILFEFFSLAIYVLSFAVSFYNLSIAFWIANSIPIFGFILLFIKKDN